MLIRRVAAANTNGPSTNAASVKVLMMMAPMIIEVLFAYSHGVSKTTFIFTSGNHRNFYYRPSETLSGAVGAITIYKMLMMGCPP